MRRALAAAAHRANRYPEFFPRRLPRLIAEHVGVGHRQVSVGTGITGVLMHILQEFVAPGERVVMATPTFDGYPILVGMVQGDRVQVPLAPDGSQDLERMVRAVDRTTRLVALCSPHNPTGSRITRAELDWFLSRVRPDVPVLLDQAYVEFDVGGELAEIGPIVAQHPNVIVLRTFSKAFGLAALRVGYAVSSTEIAARIQRWQVPFETNAFAEIGAEACYNAEHELMRRVERICAERDHLSRRLRRLGLDVPESFANCVFVAHRDQIDAEILQRGFEKEGVLVKAYPGGTRITVSDREASDTIVSVFAA
ncbi:histidinol-phosphate transaminase [Segniliparus rugosus ATCC BAA-974]|uniref:Histidinol-phosphate transaminase n=1 Tax=Segniliparus rugosus (strain ATCC BAA-974 / DSM 45345 / CCUG 50838 / CIP 108380 / JCM 13579 / CDC 945) TaxID=679197 RepID=E5XVH2_SEGRC|nr:histidinol-phosphate transaminase [Segniliparus rugosus ATCC BAA-974]